MRRLAKVLLWLAPIALVAIAFALRAAGRADVFVDGQVLPIGGEAWYHLRRVLYGAVRFPHLLGFDPYLAFPRGSLPPWSPGYDAGIAGLASIRAEPALAAARLAAWSPALLGALSVGAVYALLLSRFGAAAALVGAGLLAVLPAHVLATQVGYANHRAAGALASVLLLCAAGALLSGRERSRTAGWALGVATGAASAFALAVSMSTLPVLLLVQIALCAHFATRATCQAARAAATRSAIATAAALLLSAPFARQGLDPALLSALHPSRLHLLLFAVPLVLATACALLWRGGAGATLPRRIALALGLSLALDAALLGLVPGLWQATARFAASLFGDPSLHAAQLEPGLVHASGASGWGRVAAEWTGLGLLLPLLLPLAAWLEWPRGERAVLLLVLSSCTALAVSVLLAPGGYASGSLAVALAAGCAFGAVWRRASRAGVRAAALGLVVLAVGPALLAERARSASPAEVELGEASLDTARVIHVLQWLDEYGQPSGEWLDMTHAREYSVLAPWQLGHMIEFHARRPAVVDGFSGVLAAGRLALVGNLYREAWFRGLRTLASYGAKYLIVPDVEGFPGPGAAANGLVPTLIDHDGSETEEPEPGGPFAVQNLRLVYEYGDRSDGGGLRVYERVAGARILGSAVPKRFIRASIRLRTSGGREFTYRASRWTDPNYGTYEIRVPYATQPSKRKQFVSAIGSWVLECGDEKVTLDFADWKVRNGGTVPAPGFCY